MPIHRYAKVLLLAPPIGSALIGILGLLVGVGLLCGRGKSEKQMLDNADRHTSVPGSAPVTTPTDMQPRRSVVTPALASLAQKRGKKAGVVPDKVMFQKPIASDQLEFLTDYAGRSANEVVHEPELRNLVGNAVPYAPFHLGLDMPLPDAIESMLAQSSIPVAVREDRYVMITGTRGPNGRGRAFLWIDTHDGLVLGGIFFYPSNGEPTPTLTIFSRQLNQPSLRMSQLPTAFAQDLNQWTALVGVPPITTRYFINASSEKRVLAHDEDFCKRESGMAAPTSAACRQMNAEAAHIDLVASHFLSQTNYASNSTMRMVTATTIPSAIQGR